VASVANEQQKRQQLLRDAVHHSAYDPAYFLRFFFRHWYPTPFPPFHLGLIALLTRKVEFLNDYPEAHDFLCSQFYYYADPSDTGPFASKLAVFQLVEGKIRMVCGENNNWIVPRGFSKTTIALGCHAYDLVTDGTIFGVYVSASAEHSEMQLGNVKFELESNALLREAYGDMVPDRSEPERWTNREIQLRNGAILLARGRGGQVRGLNFRARRPNRVTLDDVEDEDSIATAELRLKTEKWFYGSVAPAGQLMDGARHADAQQPLQITNLGTLLGPECLMMTIGRDPEFNTIQFGAKLEDGQMLWAYKMEEATYDRMRSRYQRLGKLAEFTREYDSLIRVDDDSIFPSIFIYQPTSIKDLVHRSMAMDPAISSKPGSDHAAIIVAGRRLSDGALWMLDEWGGVGKTPRDKIDAFFSLHEKWQTTHNGIEAIQYQASLLFLMREEMARRNYFFTIEPIIHGSKDRKDIRIVGVLSPRYKNGYIRHLRHMPNLEGNLSDWPNGKKDYADAAAMALTLLGETQILAGALDGLIASEHEPLPELLPPVFQTASGYIVRGNSPRGVNFKQRYG
jgi:hypothetical protein